MSQIPTPPTSRPGSEAPEVERKSAESPEASSELLESLDTLLEQYLHLLDQQQELQSVLAKQLSSGFLALAHANYTCPPGRRYGADYYDERMKATGRISIQEGPENEPTNSTETSNSPLHNDEHHFDIKYTRIHLPEDQVEEKEELQVNGTTADDSPVEDSTASKPESKALKKSRPNDPIYWYGILVPPSLRTAQKSFTDTIQNQVPALAAVVVKMRALEDKINKVRMKLEG
ncbi:hypothetical protein N7520_002671 [Penicillium odoratum]|uniref:uncharacterized protein n=1 Tax=Penicillium odoratum TaxID=1167516 RepID=UPI002547A6DD|nr:uncharacterized protein N7520_002671 [Penicillium odoratum]KAJ5772142.1 hypothetical protein N7520_002671 [Penicillium odoratum]